MKHRYIKHRYFAKALGKFVATLMLVAVPLAIAPAQADIRWISDLPVMDELEIIVDLGFSFDSPDGRIIGIFATSAAAASAVKAFYNDSMPTLGWEMRADGWYRGSEILTLTRADTNFGTVWRLMVQPR